MWEADLIEGEHGTKPIELFVLDTESTSAETGGGGEGGALVVGEVEARLGRKGGEIMVESSRSGSTLLTTAGPRCTPSSSSMAKLVSIISLTGRPSGMVTSITVQRVGSPIISRTSTAWRQHTRLRSVPDAGGGPKEATACPAAEHDHDEFIGASFFEGLDAAEYQEILDARRGRGHHLEQPGGPPTSRSNP